MKRRETLQGILALSSLPIIGNYTTPHAGSMSKKIEKGPINHSVCQWCYRGVPLEEFADKCVDLGISSIELLNPEDWDKVLSRGLNCAISNGSSLGIPNGFNDPKNHAQLLSDLASIIPLAAEKGIPNIICFSGNRNGMDDMVGLENCAVGLDPVVKLAEKHGVTIIMELLNSKVDHKDYMCDHTNWGVKLVNKVGSPRFKLLYDIYHMQIMEGDVIRTIRDNHQYIAHYHTGGVPGRHEIDDSQELYYPAIMKAIAETGFTGYVAQEFIPARKDVINSLKQGVEICNVLV